MDSKDLMSQYYRGGLNDITRALYFSKVLQFLKPLADGGELSPISECFETIEVNIKRNFGGGANKTLRGETDADGLD